MFLCVIGGRNERVFYFTGKKHELRFRINYINGQWHVITMTLDWNDEELKSDLRRHGINNILNENVSKELILDTMQLVKFEVLVIHMEALEEMEDFIKEGL